MYFIRPVYEYAYLDKSVWAIRKKQCLYYMIRVLYMSVEIKRILISPVCLWFSFFKHCLRRQCFFLFASVKLSNTERHPETTTGWFILLIYVSNFIYIVANMILHIISLACV